MHVYPNLTSILKVEEEYFRYTHFSFNSNGDMFFDTSHYAGEFTSHYPGNKKRIFVGLKKNGRFYFDNIFLTLYGNIGKYEGESIFVKYSDNNDDNGKEVLCGIAKNNKTANHTTELYDMNNNNVTKIYETTEIIGYIISDSFKIEKMPNESDSIYY